MNLSSKNIKNTEYRDYYKIIMSGMLLHLILNIGTKALHIIPHEFYYRGLLIIELVLFLMTILGHRIKLKQSELCILFTIIITQFLAYAYDSLFEEYNCFDVHRLCAFIFTILCTYFFAYECKLTSKQFEKLMRIYIIVSCIACFYNLIINREYLAGFNLQRVMFYTDKFTSFFQTRSNYCLWTSASFAICLYEYKERRKLLHLLLAIFFAINVVITNARTSIIAITTVALLFLSFEEQSRVKKNLKNNTYCYRCYFGFMGEIGKLY